MVRFWEAQRARWGIVVFAALATVCALVGARGSGAASGARVALSVVGLPGAKVSADAGTSLTFIARTVGMQRGDRVFILAHRSNETRVRGVARCASSPCSGRWLETLGGVVRYQALLKHGQSVRARSSVITVAWRKAAGSISPGHYEGLVGQEKIGFDVTKDGRGIVNLQTGQINQSCNPHFSLSGGEIGPLTARTPVAPDGRFSIAASGSTVITGPDIIGTVDGQYRYTITGSGSGTFVHGTVDRDSGFSYRGVFYTCTSGTVTWTAAKV
jgi:hypothetical protein